METQQLRLLCLPGYPPAGSSSDDPESLKGGGFYGVDCNGAASHPSMQGPQEQQQVPGGWGNPVTSEAEQHRSGPLPLPQALHGGISSSARICRQEGHAPSRALSCFHVHHKEPMDAQLPGHGRQECRENAPGAGGAPVTVQPLASIVDCPTLGLGELSQCSNAQIATQSEPYTRSCRKPNRYDLCPASEVAPTVVAATAPTAAPLAPPSAPAVAAPETGCMSRYGRSSLLGTRTARRSSLTLLGGAPPSTGGPRSGAARMPPDYWSPPIATSTASGTPGNRTVEGFSGAAASSRHHIARLPMSRANGSSRPPATPAETTAPALASKSGCVRPCASVGGPMVTRSQIAAAAVAEVVRIDDSSDEEKSAPAAEPPQALCLSSEGVVTMEVANALDKSKLAASEALAELEPGAPKGHSQVATAYIIFVAAVVEGDGRCCLLNTEALRKAAAECREWDQEQHSSSDAAAAAASLAAQSGAEGSDIPSCVLVLQAHQDKCLVRLDLWMPPALPCPPNSNEPEGGGCHLDTSGGPSDDGSLYNIFSFPNQSICDLRWLNLRGALSHSCTSQSGSNGNVRNSRSDNSSSTREGCRRCGRGNSRDVTDRNTKGRDRKHTETPALSGNGKDAPQPPRNTHELSKSDSSSSNKADISKRCARSDASSHTGEAPDLPFSGLKASADAATDGPPAIAARPSAGSGPLDVKSVTGGTPPGDRKDEADGTKKRRSHTAKGLSRQSLKSGGSKETPRARSAGDTDRRLSKTRSTHKRSSHNRSKWSHRRKAEGDKSRVASPNSKGTSIPEGATVTGAPTDPTESPQVSDDSTTEKEPHHQGFLTPRNALTVTDGKPAYGPLLLARANVAPEVAAPADAPSHNGETSRNSSVRDVAGKQMGTKEPSGSSRRSAPSDVREQGSEKPQHPSEGSTTVSSSSGRDRSGSQRRHTTEESASRTHRSGKTLLRGGDFGHEPAGGAGYSGSRSCRCGKKPVQDISSAAVAVLCLELRQSQAEGLHCSKVLQTLLEASQRPARRAKASTQQELTTGDPQAVTHEASSPLAHIQPPASHDCAAQRSNSHTDSGSSGSSSSSSSSSTKRAHRHRRRSKELAKEETRSGADRPRRHHSPERRSSTGKRQRSSTSRRHHRTSSSSKRKRRREASPSTIATADDGRKKPLSCSSASDTQARQGNRSYSSSSSCRRADTCVPLDTGATPCPYQGDGGDTPAFVVKSASNEVLGAVDGTRLPGEHMEGESSPGRRSALGQKRGPWLLLCVGPPLQVASSVPVGGDIQRHSPCSSSVAHRSSSNNDQQLQRREDGVLHGRKHDFAPLRDALVPAVSEAATLCGSAWGPEEAGDCMDIRALVKFLTSSTADQCVGGGGCTSSSKKPEGKLDTDTCHYLARVLRGLVLDGHGPWDAMRKGSGTDCNLPLGKLMSLWRARGLRGFRGASSGTTAGLHQDALSCPAAAVPTTRAAAGTKGSTREAAARAAAASPPGFDLLLDDKTLRRLREKEFLDDTIIDFCLGFIVDHVIPHSLCLC